MANKMLTVFQNLDKVISGNWDANNDSKHNNNTYDLSKGNGNNVIYKTDNKADYEKTKLELQQNSYLNDRWVKANVNLSVQAFSGLNNVKLMYRDADLMDAFPEIGTALDIISEECSVLSPKGQIVNVYSKSDRIKNVLEELFTNRLDLQVTAPMIIRGMCKYGNQFMMLNIDNKLGITGWRQLPVFNVERLENGIRNQYSSYAIASNSSNNNDLSTKFVWQDEQNSQVPFRNWQIGHFRLLTDSLYLPYGCLVGDTRIETEYDYKEMSDIEIGDKVWTFNIEKQKKELATVTMFMPKGKKDVYRLNTEHTFIEGTFDHKLLINANGEQKYKEIGEIKVGDLLVVKNNEEIIYDTVTEISYNGEKETYDFTVSNDNSNFFANGIVTHNCSYLNKARRHWRMLSLMEDMMLIYRLDRSIERRVYKIYVGAIDDADVKAYVEDIANNFKRTPIVDPMTGQLDLRKNILPVHKDTPIPLLDGRTISIEELSKEFNDGKENYVYSIQDDTHKVVLGKVVWCGKNYTADKLVKITLDDDTHVIMAKEHELIMRDGSKKRADCVSAGESVMPFYTTDEPYSKKYKQNYERVYNPNSGKYEFTHRIVGEHLTKEKGQTVIHHCNYNRHDNTPINLRWMGWFEHKDLHTRDREALAERFRRYNKLTSSIEERRTRGLKLGYRADFKAYNESELHKQHNVIRREVNIQRWKDEENRKLYCEHMTVKFDEFVWNKIRQNILNGNINTQNALINYVNENLIDYLLSINTTRKLQHYKKVTKPLVRARIQELGFESFAQYYESVKKNHKIKSVEYVDGDDVYCMTVVGLNGEEDRHNFAICSWNENKEYGRNGIFVSNCADQDLFIPVRDPNAPTPIDTLSAAQNLTAMDDIKFVQNKVLTALRIPKSFLNFEETTGDGKNLSLMDIRFTRTVNRIQQAFLMELTKIASIHLYILGFTDELTNFSLSMNNPSTQAEQLEIDNIQKKITAIRDAVSDPGNGIPIMSQTRALKEIMKWSDKDIQNNLEEIRLEKAVATELEKTSQIIKKTGIFDTVDRVYGEPGAEYQEGQDMEGADGMSQDSGGGGGFGGGMDIGDASSDADQADADVDALGDMGTDDASDINGNESEIPISDNEQPKNESKLKRKKPLNESKKKLDEFFLERFNKRNETVIERTDVYDKALMINEDFNDIIKSLDGIKS